MPTAHRASASDRCIDLSGATADELDALEKACQPAPFGCNDQTAFDDSYRKAGKMEVDDFMLEFDAERAGLIEIIRSFLFHGAEEEKFIMAELYKLNVYGAPIIISLSAKASMPRLDATRQIAPPGSWRALVARRLTAPNGGRGRAGRRSSATRK